MINNEDVKKTKEEIDLMVVSIDKYPSWIKFIFFITKGRSFKSFKKERILCFFGRHEFSVFLYGFGAEKVKFESCQNERDGFRLSFGLQCRWCGFHHHFKGLYAGYDEHRFEEVKDYEKIINKKL